MTALQKVTDTAIADVEYFSDTTIDRFVASRHGSANTCKTYRNTTLRLVKYFAVNGISQPTTADFDAYINTLRTAGKSASTLRLYNAVGKLFFAFLEKQGIYHDVTKDAAPLKLRKSLTHNKKALTDEQAKKLLNAVKGDDLIARRDRCIIALALTCGLRTVEISRANVEDFQQGAGYWTLAVQGKGRLTKDETVKIAEPVAELINAYLALRGNVQDDEPLFVSASHNIAWKKNSFGNRLSEQSVGKLIRHNMIKVGIVKPAKKDKHGKIKRSPISAHSTRHYCATCAIKAGIDIRDVSAMLRHTSIVVTSTYLHDISLETRKAELCVANSLFGSAA